MNYQLALEIAVPLIKRFEGLSLTPYLCPAGVWTIGYGATRYPDGRRVAGGDVAITAEFAQYILTITVKQLIFRVMRLCPGINSPERLAALTSFAFNLGLGKLQASTLRKRVNAHDWSRAAVELMKWVYAAGKKLRGLETRRRAEASLL